MKMRQEDRNELFARTSFLHGANAGYIEDLYGRFQENPGTVNADWRAFFTDLKERKEQVVAEVGGPSWRRTDWPLPVDSDLISALGGGFEVAERDIEHKIAAKAQEVSVELTSEQTMQAVRDFVHALMMIRVYRVRGHLTADLDPLKLNERKPHPELQPESYGFTEADFDRPIYLDKVLGLEVATVREIMDVLRRTYCAKIGYEFMHISSPEQKAWI